MRTTNGSLLRTVGKGLAAGLAGTAVMTVGQLIQMRLRHREPSTAPAEAMETLLGFDVEDPKSEQRLANAVHFAYGTAWGVPRALLARARVGSGAATSVHLALVWAAALAMLPRLGLAPPVREWGKEEIAEDLAMHAVYAWATGAALRWLERR